MAIKKIFKYIEMRYGFNYVLDYNYGKKHQYNLGELGEKNIYFLMTPTYGNMGDQAIEYAIREFIKAHFQDFNLICVNLENTLHALHSIECNIKQNDIVILQGGGNFGDLYPYCEEVRRFVLKKIRHNYVISMPSTLTYSINNKEFKKTMRVINKNKMFINLCREKYSLDFAERYFTNCVNILCPDIVYYLKKIDDKFLRDRKDVCVCLRNDIEKVDTTNREEIIKIIFGLNTDTVISDTQLYRSVPNNVKKEEIISVFNKFHGYKMVITDRLHGMILSYVTKTPCIVFRSLDKKIIGSYEWIKNCNYITFLDNYDEEILLKKYSELLEVSPEPCNELIDIIETVGKQIKEIVQNGKSN